MMKLILSLFFVCTLNLPLSLLAGKAHQHGAAELTLAPQANALTITLHSAADNILGFEHEPRTDRQKETKQKAEAILKTQISDLFSLPTDLNCQWKVDRFEDGSSTKPDSHHRDYAIQWSAQCKKPLPQTLIINLGNSFPRIHKLSVVVLGESGQKSLKLKNATGEINL